MKFSLIVAFLQLSLVWKLCESISCDVPAKNTEGRLHQHLFCNYDKTVRPVGNSKQNTTVKVKLVVKSFDYQDTTGALTIHSWLSMSWTDEHLKWERKEYDNLDSITVSGDDLWLPDLAIYNSKTTQHSETCKTAHCVLSDQGVVSCIPPCEHEALCNSDYTYWPYDSQNCSMHLGSWVHKGEEIDYQQARGAIEFPTLLNKEWRMIRISVKKNRGNFSCCPSETYPSLQYNFLIERHSAAEKAFILTPAIILASMNLITLWLSPNTAERITMCLVGVFGHFMFIQQLSWMVPKNGNNVPNILLYFRDSLIISAMLTLYTLIMRGLLSCKSSIPGCIKTTTETLKGNKVGQLMFSNPYLINSSSGNTINVTDDSANLVERGAAEPIEEVGIDETSKKIEGGNIWATTVKILDMLMFLILLISYIIMLFALIPESYKKIAD